MGNWQSREVKLKQRQAHKDFSKPFRKKHDKDKRDSQKRIREAQRLKNDSRDEEDDVSYG